jgi:RimJ/RimL family protein N-acetyltransferase
MMIPTHHTERLTLRPFRESDVDSLVEFHADPLTYSIYKVEPKRGDMWRRIAVGLGHWELRGFGGWALEEKSTQDYVGACGHWFPEGWDDVEIGYGIHPKHRGKGYAVEAALFVRELGSEKHGFVRQVSYIQPNNSNSIRVAEKMGAVPDGTFDMSGISHTVYLHRKH